MDFKWKKMKIKITTSNKVKVQRVRSTVKAKGKSIVRVRNPKASKSESLRFLQSNLRKAKKSTKKGNQPENNNNQNKIPTPIIPKSIRKRLEAIQSKTI